MGVGEFFRVAALLALPIVAASVPARSQVQAARPLPVADEAALAGFDAFVSDTIEQWKVPGLAIAIVRDGKVVLAKGYGVRDIDTGAPVTSDTIFPIASVTKSFLSFDVGLLVDEGRLDLDAPIRTYLPDFALKDRAAGEALTLRDILSHRSGMPQHDGLWYHNASLSRADLLARFRHLEPSAAATEPYNLVAGQKLLFVSDVQGRISGVQLSMDPAVSPVLFARPPAAESAK